MSRFNVYMNTHFQGSGCRLIARARDTCRNRDVTLHAMPGYWDVVGVSDGVDAWVASASAGPFFHTATGDVAHIMRALQAGEPLPPVPDAPTPQPRKRAQLLSTGDPPPRRQRALLNNPLPAQQPNPRKRHVLLA